jgi:hypothetical protein
MRDVANESLLAARQAYQVPETGKRLKSGQKLSDAYRTCRLCVSGCTKRACAWRWCSMTLFRRSKDRSEEGAPARRHAGAITMAPTTPRRRTAASFSVERKGQTLQRVSTRNGGRLRQSLTRSQRNGLARRARRIPRKSPCRLSRDFLSRLCRVSEARHEIDLLFPSRSWRLRGEK